MKSTFACPATNRLQSRLLSSLLVLGALVAPTLAQASSMTHEYYSRGRSPYGSNLYVSQQAHYARTTTRAEASSETTQPAGDYRGYSLQTSVGLEHFRFLQTGLFYSSAQTTAAAGGGDSLGGHEFGAEARIVLTSPVANVGLGGGAYLTKKDLNLGQERSTLQGSGMKAGVEFTYFCSPRVSLVATAAQHMETLTNRSNLANRSNQTEGLAASKVHAQSTRIGGGVSIWL